MILCQIGELTRNKNKQVVNPFPEGKALMLKFQELVQYFIQAKVHRHNYDIILEHSPENPKTKIERDLNSINPNKVLNIIGLHILQSDFQQPSNGTHWAKLKLY